MKNKQNQELLDFKNAVWDYILEHSDIQKGGALFVKFHTKSKTQFLGHVNARIKGYHREDPKEKEKKSEYVFEQHVAKKKRKNEKWVADKKTRTNALKKVAIENKIRKYPPIVKEIARFYLNRLKYKDLK